MLIIRLQRIGKRHAAQYRLVAAEKSRPVGKKVLKVLGNYHPVSKVLTVSDKESLQKYVDLNVEMSLTVASILKKNGIVKAQVEKPVKEKKTAPKKTAAKKTTKAE